MQSPEEREWTPAILELTIAGYGVPDVEPETLQMHHENWGVDRFEFTSADKDEIFGSIEVDRENLYGLPADEYLGMVHYCPVPLCGDWSDMTAQFQIKKVGNQELTLEFLNIHVM